MMRHIPRATTQPSRTRRRVFYVAFSLLAIIVLFNLNLFGNVLQYSETEEELDSKTKKIASLTSQLEAEVAKVKTLEDELRTKDALIESLNSKLNTNEKPPDGHEQVNDKNNKGPDGGALFSSGPNTVSAQSAPDGIAVVIVCFNRPKELQRTIDGILEKRPASGFPLYITQDGDEEGVSEVIQSTVSDNEGSAFHLRFSYSPQKLSGVKTNMKVYHRISDHYGWMFRKMFDELNYRHVIILEDDMDVAPDFFDYFTAMKEVLDEDPTVYCVSAWNDNGQKQFVADPRNFLRTDVFPGLGWMLSSKLWADLKEKWPPGFYDDWLRLVEQTKNRTCIFPEVNRVYTFGKEGSSAGLFFDKYLEPIKLNDERVDYSSLDLSYLHEPAYKAHVTELLRNAEPVADSREVKALRPRDHSSEDRSYYLEYGKLSELTKYSKELGLMTDHKWDMPRTSYDGILQFRWNGNRVIMVPKEFMTSL